MRSEKAWSLLDPKPVPIYLQHQDDFIVYWNGIVMPHRMALVLAMEHFGIYPTPEVKTALRKNYERLYYSGAFQTRAWDQMVSNSGSEIISYLRRKMQDHLSKTLENRTAQEVFAWFDYKRARHEEYKVNA